MSSIRSRDSFPGLNVITSLLMVTFLVVMVVGLGLGFGLTAKPAYSEVVPARSQVLGETILVDDQALSPLITGSDENRVQESAATQNDTDFGDPANGTVEINDRTGNSSVAVPEILTPQSDSYINTLDTISGTIEKNHDVIIYLDSQKLARVSTQPDGDQYSFSYSLTEPLAPGRHYVTAQAISSNNLRSNETAKTNFLVNLPQSHVLANDTDRLVGIETINVRVKGEVQTVELYASHSSGLQYVFLGTPTLSSVEDVWSLTFNSKNLSDGQYAIVSRVKGLDNRHYISPPLSFEIKNTADTEIIDIEETATIDLIQSEDGDTVSVEASDALPIVGNPRTDGTLAPNKLKIREVNNIRRSAEERPAIVLKGIGPPDTIVILYIYSEPLVVTTRTDESGNWTYVVDKSLDDGRHEVYVTVTDDTGKITERGNPLAFFVSEALAISEEDFLRNDVNVPTDNNLFLVYTILAVALVIIVILIILAIHYNRHRNNLISSR
jgi:hypothetical protein